MTIRPRTLLAAASIPAALGFLLLTARPAQAWPPYLTDWQNIYPGSSTDDNVINGLGQGCAVCHFSQNGGTGWNPYGWEIRQKFLAGDTIPNAILKAALWDSDANPRSWSNITEITGDTQPGWTPGPNNIEYTDMSTVTGQMPIAGILGSLDPAVSPMVPMCDPGMGGVLACPCGNPQAGLNRGCENSGATTGAALTAVGTESLGGDTVVFTTAGERNTALTILLQGTTSIAAGTQYGQGVRCLGGSLRRLYVKSASAGSITAPGMGDLSVSAQSAAKGDTILPGTSRWYLAYYRDPNILGGCAAVFTFNATQTGQVDWMP
jgi:hypothetical protein